MASRTRSCSSWSLKAFPSSLSASPTSFVPSLFFYHLHSTWNDGKIIKQPLAVEAVGNGSGRDLVPGSHRPAHGRNLVDFVNVFTLPKFVTINHILQMVAAILPLGCSDDASIHRLDLRRRIWEATVPWHLLIPGHPYTRRSIAEQSYNSMFLLWKWYNIRINIEKELLF